MNGFIDVTEYFRNLNARKQIMAAYPQLADILTEVYLMRSSYMSSEDGREIFWPKFRESCADVLIDSRLWETNRFFTDIYHIVHAGKLTVQERWELCKDEVQLSNIYVLDTNEIEAVIDYLVDTCKVFDGVIDVNNYTFNP